MVLMYYVVGENVQVYSNVIILERYFNKVCENHET